MDSINFSSYWNGNKYHHKLMNHYFSTIRLRNSQKWIVGKTLPIYIKKKYIKTAEILSVINIRLADLPDVYYYLDTGYSKKESIKMICTMYRLTEVEVNEKIFSMITFRTVEG